MSTTNQPERTPKKPIRQAICDAAMEMQRGSDSEQRRAEAAALKSILKNDADEKCTALAAYEASRAYHFAARELDRLRVALDSGEIG